MRSSATSSCWEQGAFTTCFALQGINRLGKGPPKPGSYRPPDPNKYRTMDMYSEGAEGDADYMRMVQDVSFGKLTCLRLVLLRLLKAGVFKFAD